MKLVRFEKHKLIRIKQNGCQKWIRVQSAAELIMSEHCPVKDNWTVFIFIFFFENNELIFFIR